MSKQFKAKSSNPIIIDFQDTFSEQIAELSQVGIVPSLQLMEGTASIHLELVGDISSTTWRESWSIISRMQEWMWKRDLKQSSKQGLINQLLVKKWNGHSWESLTDSLNRELMSALYQHVHFPKRNTIITVRSILTNLGFSDQKIDEVIADAIHEIRENRPAFPDEPETHRKSIPGAWKRVSGPIKKENLRNTLKEPWKDLQAWIKSLGKNKI